MAHHHHSHPYTATVEKKEKSTVLISVEIPESAVIEHRASAIKALGQHIKIDGFRAGHIPEKVLVAQIGEMAILTEAAEETIRHTYPHVLQDKEIDAIGAPDIVITKLAPGNPLTFTATVAVLPTLELPDYKKIAKEQNADKKSTAVTDAEVDEAIEKLLRQKMAYERLQGKAQKQKENADVPETIETEEDYSKIPLPELTDEYVTTLGNFTSVENFKSQLRTHLEIEKKDEVIGAHRAKVTDAIIDKTVVDMPQVLIDSEIDQMFGQMETDLTRANLTIDNYLEHLKKTRDDLRAEWAPSAEKRAKLQLVLNEIAKNEAIEPDKAAVEVEVERLLSQFKDANVDRVRVYIESVLRNDAVMKMLESV